MEPEPELAGNLTSVRRRIFAAADRSHRSPSDITLLAVSKTFDSDLIREVFNLGQRHFGENRVQEAAAKRDQLIDLPITWHLIGHLQSNKVRKAAAVFDWIHSVDRLDVLSKLDAAAGEAGRRPKILIQIDLAGETTKFGADRSIVQELVAAATAAPHVDLRGLMIIPPYPETAEQSRPWFTQLRALRDELLVAGIEPRLLAELSMGMSHDFEVAIEEGATMVRVGTAIFGHRSYGGES